MGRWRRRLPLEAGRPSLAGAESAVSEELEQNLSFFVTYFVLFGLFNRLYLARKIGLFFPKLCVVFLYQLLCFCFLLVSL